MLPRPARLTRSAEFTDVVRRGRRAGRRLLTVHVDVPSGRLGSQRSGPPTGGCAPARAGLVVSRAVGGSVVRSRTARRLRHLLRSRLPDLPPGARVVVRASAAAGSASSAALGADLDAALARAVGRVPARRSPGRAAPPVAQDAP